MKQPGGLPWVHDAFNCMLLAVALSAYCGAGYLAWFHLTQGPPAQRVHIRWAPTVSASERVRVEREHGLVAGVPFEGRTWQYFLRRRSRSDIERLVTDPRVEDTFHIDRISFRIQLDRPQLSPRARAWLESDRLGQISLALAVIATLMTWRSRRTLTAIVRATTRWSRQTLVAIVHEGEGTSLNGEYTRLWVIGVGVVWTAITLPYVMVGPPDFEEYVTGITTTHISMDAIVHGAWPFWSLDLGLGAPQPLRFHFITHPLAPFCVATDCHALLRSIASMHVLVGAIFMMMLAQRFTGNRLLAAAAGLTWCMSSSVVQPIFTDDWPFTALHESAVPVMVYAVLAIGDESNRRHAVFWSLVLGGICGLVLSMTFPMVTLIVITIVALSTPGLRGRFPWLVLAAFITVLIGAAQVHHIFEEFVRTPPGVIRVDHDDVPIVDHLRSAFLRPIHVLAPRNDWRTVFFGPPFAVAALVAAITIREAEMRPIRIGLLLGALGFIVPPGWLFNINTAQFLYRTELNVFGILLAVYGIVHWTSTPRRLRWRWAIVVVQLCWVTVAFVPVWRPVYAVAAGLRAPSRNTLVSPGIAEEIAAREREARGRVIFAPEAYKALREPQFNRMGLAPNELSVLGVPTVSAVLFGITTDDLSPQSATLEGQVRAAAGTTQSRPLLNVLAIRYVLAFGHDTVAEGLHEIRQWTNGLRLYENSQAWPEAFFVDTLRDDPIPRLANCGDDRFLCADFSKYDLHRRADPLEITRLHDGLRLTFPPHDSRRYLLITQWHYPEWTVTAGRASLRRAAEQFIGVEISPGEHSVTVQYRPRLRATLFVMGILTEVVVALAIAVLVVTRARSSSQVEAEKVQQGA